MVDACVCGGSSAALFMLSGRNAKQGTQVLDVHRMVGVVVHRMVGGVVGCCVPGRKVYRRGTPTRHCISNAALGHCTSPAHHTHVASDG